MLLVVVAVDKVPRTNDDDNPVMGFQNPSDDLPLKSTYFQRMERPHFPGNVSNNTTATATATARLPEDSCKGSHYRTWKPRFSRKADTLSCELAYEQFETNLCVLFSWQGLSFFCFIPLHLSVLRLIP